MGAILRGCNPTVTEITTCYLLFPCLEVERHSARWRHGTHHRQVRQQPQQQRETERGRSTLFYTFLFSY